jgi:hypothetical protein
VSIIISITALFILNTTGFVASTNFATGIVKLIQPTMWILLVFSIILLIDISSKIYKKYIKE